jgi:hypothetical protein
MSKPKRIQRSRAKGWKMPANAKFLRKTLKLFWSDPERTDKDTTLSKNQSTYEQQIPF